MAHKIIKLTEAQINNIMNEDYPFGYFGNNSTDTNGESSISVEGPEQSKAKVEPNINIDDMFTNSSWWNRSYGYTGGYFGPIDGDVDNISNR